MSTISSGTTLTTALVQTGDTTGDLVIKTGSSNTTAITIAGSNQSVTFAGAISSTGSTLTNPTINGNVTTTGLNFDSNTFVIDATNNRVGVGRASPSSALDVNGVATFSAGSVSAPAITTTGDTNTGIFFPAADTIAFSEGGTEVARFDSAGNLGIGTTTPDDKLKVVTSNGGGIRVGDGTVNALLGTGAGPVGRLYTITNHGFIFGTNDIERMRLNAGGDFCVGTTSAAGKATIQWNGATQSGLVTRSTSETYSGSPIVFRNSSDGTSGFIGQGTSSVSYNTSSDYRLKENITPMIGALGIVSLLKPVTYTWKVDGSSGQGFIAHELQAVVPDCVSGEKDAVEIIDKFDEQGNKIGTKEVPKYQGVDTSFLVATLTAAIQEQTAIINDLKARIETLEAK